jgi:hypothetical protein
MLAATKDACRSDRSWIRRAPASILISSILALAPLTASATGPDDAASTSQPVPEACRLADHYNSSSRPDRALALIDRVRATSDEEVPPASNEEKQLCSTERSEALRRVDLAERLATAAELARIIEDEKTPEEDRRGAEEKLRASLPDAFTGQGFRLPEALTCGTAPLAGDSMSAQLQGAAAACDASVADDPPTETWSEERESSWKTFFDDHLAPLEEPLIGLLVAITAGVVLALLVTWPMGRLTTWAAARAREGGRLPSTVHDVQPVVMAIGAGTIVGAAAWAVFGGNLWGAGIVLVVGAITFGWALSQSLRLSIRVKDAAGQDDANASAHVAGLIRELAAPDLRGIEAPPPVGGSALENAGLTSTPEGRLANAAYRLLQLLVPRTPWVVNVHEESADVLAVTVVQHGRLVLGDVIDRDLIRLRIPLVDDDGKPIKSGDTERYPDLRRVAAAMAVAALGSRYEMRGLAGATSWRGIGRHFVARTDLRGHPDRPEVLARALNADPENQAVLLEYWYSLYRNSTDPEKLRLYARFLEAFSARKVTPDLLLRAARSRYVALVNAYYAQAAEEPDNWTTSETARQARLAVIHAIEHMDKTVTKAKSDGVKQELIGQAEQALGPALAWLQLWDDTGAPRDELFQPQVMPGAVYSPPSTSYGWACFYASRAQTRHRHKEDLEHVIVHLRAVEGSKRLVTWRSKDPQLKGVWQEPALRKAFGRKPLKTLGEVSALTEHMAALKKIGATSPEAVLQHGKTELGLLLEASAGQAGVVRQVAQLALSVPPALSGWRYELTDLLVKKDVLSVVPGSRSDLVGPLGEAMEASLADPPSRELLADWLGT